MCIIAENLDTGKDPQGAGNQDKSRDKMEVQPCLKGNGIVKKEQPLSNKLMWTGHVLFLLDEGI